jgi:hypothetical protein
VLRIRAYRLASSPRDCSCVTLPASPLADNDTVIVRAPKRAAASRLRAQRQRAKEEQRERERAAVDTTAAAPVDKTVTGENGAPAVLEMEEEEEEAPQPEEEEQGEWAAIGQRRLHLAFGATSSVSPLRVAASAREYRLTFLASDRRRRGRLQ